MLAEKADMIEAGCWDGNAAEMRVRRWASSSCTTTSVAASCCCRGCGCRGNHGDAGLVAKSFMKRWQVTNTIPTYCHLTVPSRRPTRHRAPWQRRTTHLALNSTRS